MMNKQENAEMPDSSHRGSLIGRFAASPGLVALLLSLALLVIPAYQLGATFLLQGNSSEVTRAVAGGLSAQPVRMGLTWFVAALIALHGAYGLMVLILARLTSGLRPHWKHQTAGLVVVWFCSVTLSVLGLNAFWFPQSESGAYYYRIASTPVAGLAAAQLVAMFVVLVAAVVCLASLIGLARRHPAKSVPAAGLLVLVITVLLFHDPMANEAKALNGSGHSPVRPHVIVLGIDSLRLQELARRGGTGKMPHLDEFLADADMFMDVTTPAARTFPSWAAILSGRPPSETGASSNLLPRELLDVNPTLADTLRAAGYRTVLATDEVRFSNIDQSYGFDQLITPPIGAADFLVERISDLPLVNVVANTWLGGHLFPYTHANRAAAKIFKPRSFLQRLDTELDFDGPTLLVAHLCAAHWPYFVAGVPREADTRQHDQDRPLYDIGLQTADAMFGETIDVLRRKGALQNAIVVVLSDHGEALAVSGDSLIGDDHMARISGLQMPVNVMDWGHGQSVLSPVQYQVLLSFRTFGDVRGFESSGRTLRAPATVVDLTPTLLDLVGIPAQADYDYAMSLRPLLIRQGEKALVGHLSERPRFTETDLRATADAKGNIDEAAAVRESSIYFKVNSESGRLELRPEALTVIRAFKERAALLGPWILAALPADLEHHQYLLVDRTTGTGRILANVPSPEDVEAYALWQALQAEFPGEMLPPTVLRPDQVAAVNQRWVNLLVNARMQSVGEPRGYE